MTGIRKGYVDHDAGQLHYRSIGDLGAGRCWVLLHHSASDARSLDLLATELAADSTVVAFDTPGFGNSDPLPATTVPGLAAAISQGLLALGMREWKIFGFHTGASIATRLAAEGGTAVRSVVLSGLVLPAPQERDRLAPLLTPLRPDRDGSHIMTAWQRCRGYYPAASLDMVTRETVALLNADQPHLAYAAVLDYDPRTDLDRIAQRTLVVCGGNEYLAGSVYATAALLPEGIGVIVPGASLDLPETHHAELARVIRQHVSTSTD